MYTNLFCHLVQWVKNYFTFLTSNNRTTFRHVTGAELAPPHNKLPSLRPIYLSGRIPARVTHNLLKSKEVSQKLLLDSSGSRYWVGEAKIMKCITRLLQDGWWQATASLLHSPIPMDPLLRDVIPVHPLVFQIRDFEHLSTLIWNRRSEQSCICGVFTLSFLRLLLPGTS